VGRIRFNRKTLRTAKNGIRERFYQIKGAKSDIPAKKCYILIIYANFVKLYDGLVNFKKNYSTLEKCDKIEIRSVGRFTKFSG